MACGDYKNLLWRTDGEVLFDKAINIAKIAKIVGYERGLDSMMENLLVELLKIASWINIQNFTNQSLGNL